MAILYVQYVIIALSLLAWLCHLELKFECILEHSVNLRSRALLLKFRECTVLVQLLLLMLLIAKCYCLFYSQ